MKPATLSGRPLALLSSVLFLLLAAGCSIPMPQAQQDPTKVFVLSAPGTTAAKPDATGAPAVRLRPVEVAGYLRVQPMIVRRGENEIEFREYARWGEPLEQGVARVIREELLARGGAAAVQMAGARSSGLEDPKFEISVRVLAAEGGAAGLVNFQANWDVIALGGAPRVVATGRYHPADLRWTPKDEATLASALSRAVAGLAAEIAAGLKE